MTDNAKSEAPLVIQTQHTPTPWKIRHDFGGHIQGSPEPGQRYGDPVTNIGGLCRPKTQGRANAEFIVCAVNSHAVLLNALKQARGMLNAYGSPTDVCHALLMEDIDAALSKAEQRDHGSPVVNLNEQGGTRDGDI